MGIFKLSKRPCHWCTESEIHQCLYRSKFILEHTNASGFFQLPLRSGKLEFQSTAADLAFLIGQLQTLPVTVQ